MKKLLLLIGISFISLFSQAQLKISANDKGDLSEIKKDLKFTKGIPSEKLIQRYPIYKINGLYYISSLFKVNSSFSKTSLKKYSIQFGSQIGQIVSVKIPLTILDDIFFIEGIEQFELATKIIPHLDKAVKDVRADSVQYGLGLPQSFTGKDVFIGITDWGFDYTHPMFYDTTLTQTRIFAAWDQYKTSGPAPAGHNYGTEFSTIPDLLAAGSDTSNIYSYALHGSHVAGICGGSGAGTNYRGVAFDAQYLFATFLVDNASVLDAYAWMYEKAETEQKRLVINMSWGLYYMGTLDGNSILSQAIDNYAALGVVFCNSAGNNGGVNFHIKKNFSNDTIKSKIDFYTSSTLATLWGQSISMWGEAGNAFAAKVSVLNSSNTLLNESIYYSTATTVNYIDTFLVVGNDTVFYNISADNQHPSNGKPQMRLRIRNTNTSLKIILNATASTGTVHFWNVTELSNDVGNWGMPFTAINANYVAGDDNYGISEPACTRSLITVAAYASEYYNSSGTTLLGGTIASFSSKGPTIDNDRMKPDIAAPGVSVGSSISSYTDNSFTPLTSVNFNGRTYPFARLSGTSMSSPMVTGIVALILESNPNLSPEQIKQIIIQTARTDSKTGVIPDTGSVRWGFGKIHAWRAVQLALQTDQISESNLNDLFMIYPNPSNSILNISYSDDSKDGTIEIIALEGKKMIFESELKEVINVQQLMPGIYFIHVNINNVSHTLKFIKQ
ncbi:MAG: S8 family peptidase [Flavobacteriia bacterium]|nr:S8 family peptidase [Flavobacteriia bacterium]